MNTPPTNINTQGQEMETLRTRVAELEQAESALRRENQALRESEALFKSVVENTSDLVIRVNTKGKITYINPASRYFLGCDPRECIGKRVTQFIHPEDSRASLQSFTQWDASGAKSTYHENRIVNTNGEIFYVAWAVRAVETKNDMEFAGIGRNISEYKLALEALTKSESQLARFQSIAHLGAWEWDLATNEVKWSDELFRIFGASRNNYSSVITLADFAKNIHPDDQSMVMDAIQCALRDPNYHYDVEIRVVSLKGTWHIVRALGEVQRDASGNPRLMLGTIYDITEMKKAERELKESRANFISLIENTADRLWTVDTELRVVIINSNYQRDFQIAFGTLLEPGKYALEGIPEPLLGIWLLRFRRALNGEHFTVEDDFSIPDVPNIIETAFNPIILDGKVAGVACFARDVTRFKQAERILQRNKEELEELVSQRTAELKASNDELESFAYSVSHDLRAPLRHIDAYTRLLSNKMGKNLDEEGKFFLEKIHDSTINMGKLIDGLLQLSRTTRGDLNVEEVDLSSIAREIIPTLQETNSDRVVEWIIDSGMTTRGDPRLIKAALQNLISNALKFSANRNPARIEVGSQNKDLAKTLWDMDQVVYFVRDNGIGFDMSYSDKLFGAFERLHKENEYPGSGIGLATVQRIVHRHGGKIWVEAGVDQGATFYFTLNA